LWTSDSAVKRKNVELDNSLTILLQNIRGLRNKSEELINSFEVDKIHPHDLCYTEHHMVEQDLLLSNFIGYSLGSSYSCHIFQRGGVCIFIRKDIRIGLMSVIIVRKRILKFVLCK
jgi:hypothetical protein